MASDQRLDSECREHVRKALLKILTRGKDHTPAEVADALSVALPLPSEAPCMNPRCENMCAWPSGSGRPRDFCSRTCRQACYRTLERLRAELDLIETVLARGTATYPERVALSAAAAKLRWWIRRYPNLPSDRGDQARGEAS